MADGAALPEFIDLALNEATWFGMDLDAEHRRVALGFDVLTLPDGPGGSGHAWTTLVFGDVARIVVSFRRGRWDDEDAPVVSLSVEDVAKVVESFGELPIYGWEFFDLAEESWARWANRLSVDVRWRDETPRHSITVFKEGWQDGDPPHLDCRIWFDTLDAYAAERQPVSLDEFAAGGKRWWDAMYAGDERTRTSGIVPLERDEGGT